MKNPYCESYRRKIKELQDVQKPALKSLKMKQGYRVFSREELDLALIIDYEKIIAQAKMDLENENNFSFIFNTERDSESDGFSTSLRHQLSLNVGKYTGQLVIKAIGNEYSVSRPVAIRSLAGCPAQQEHRDYTNRLEKLSFGVLWSPFMGSKVLVSPLSHFTKTTLKPLKSVELKEGEMLIFHSFLSHAGAAFEEENLRLHCYAGNETVVPVNAVNHTKRKK